MAKLLLMLICLFSATYADLSHEEAVRLLAFQGISVSSSGGCSDKDNPRCTSLEQVRILTISAIIELKERSGCEIVITGGTEAGHSLESDWNHWNGWKADIRLNTCLNIYISSLPYIGKREDGAPMYFTYTGYIYAFEGNHWDGLYIK